VSFLETMLENFRSDPKGSTLIEIHGKEQRATPGDGILDLIARARTFLSDAGVKKGDRVGLLAPNSTQWVATDLAILASGAVAVPLYARQDPKELAVMMNDSGPSLLIAGDETLASAMKEAWPEHCTVALLGEVCAAEPTTDPVQAIEADDPVSIIYTSGTSGVPKGVVFTRANLDFMIPQIVARIGEVVGGGDGAPDRTFHYLPFCFAASRLTLWMQLSRPNPLMMSTDLANLVEEMGTAEPNYYLNVPAVLERIRNGVGQKIRERGGLALALYEMGLQAHGRRERGQTRMLDSLRLAIAESMVFAKIKQQIGKSLEFLICGSAPLSEETQKWFQMLGIPVYQAYGLTETTGIVTVDKPDRVVAGRVGHAIDGVELKVAEDGELLVRGPNVFTGYWNNPEETKTAIVDGWFHTGDQVDIENANLKIIGRVKNLIVPESGHNVAPEPIEQAFMEACPDAEHCMVVGHARPSLGILVTGSVSDAAIEAGLEEINESLPHYKRIRKFHRTKEPFSIENGLLTANQKLRRGAIEDGFRAAIDAMYQ
jgi:long-chain acyl-CoA synthetase